MRSIRQILQLKGNNVWSVRPDDSVFDALKMMADKDVGALLVMEADKLVGIISERDYARKIILLGKASKNTPVKDIMSSKVFVIHPSQTSEEAMDLMTQKRVRHLPVVEENNEVVGVISIGDVLRDIIYHQRETIKRISEEGK